MRKKTAAFFSSGSSVFLREVSKYGVISGPYFPVLGLNTDTGKYGPELRIWTLFTQCVSIRFAHAAITSPSGI